MSHSKGPWVASLVYFSGRACTKGAWGERVPCEVGVSSQGKQPDSKDCSRCTLVSSLFACVSRHKNTPSLHLFAAAVLSHRKQAADLVPASHRSTAVADTLRGRVGVLA